MAKKHKSDNWELKPQKSSAAQVLTYIASTGSTSEKAVLQNLSAEECL